MFVADCSNQGVLHVSSGASHELVDSVPSRVEGAVLHTLPLPQMPASSGVPYTCVCLANWL